METEVEEDLLVIAWVPESNALSNDKSVSTNEETPIEEFVGDATFAGQSASKGKGWGKFYGDEYSKINARFEYRPTKGISQ